tara:strand:- start:6460 stop:7506 length:1047 start_codon:yes stop_codon:yes gene_type:complete
MSSKAENNDLVALVSDQAELFMRLTQAGYVTSLQSHTLPITISDKALSGAVNPDNAVLRHENAMWSIEYQAAAIKTNNKVEHYFATKAANTLIEGIWHLINSNLCSLVQIKETFQVRFRKNDLRKALKDMGSEKNGTQINKLLTILESSTLTVTKKGDRDNRNTSLSMKGTYLQNARTITSDDPAVDGLYEAILHPVLANDLFRGDYRDISIQYLGSTSELNEIYRSLIHMMRHEFTRADASKEQYAFTLWFDELLWSSGKLSKLKQNSKRRTLGSLESLLIKTGVISGRKNFYREWVMNGAAGEKDFKIVLTPSIEWGKDQRRSNQKFKLLQQKVQEITYKTTLLLD